MSELHEALTSSIEVPEEERQRFRVDGPSTAEWALMKLAKVRDKIAENLEIAEAERSTIQVWLDETNGALEADARYFEGVLIEYHRGILADEAAAGVDDKHQTKSIKLPHGTLKSVAGRPSVAVDPETFLPWAEQNAPSLVRVKKEPDAKAIMAEVTTTGEALPGVTVNVGERTFKVVQ